MLRSACQWEAASAEAVPTPQRYCSRSTISGNWVLPRERLQELGLSLGADVPVFLFGQNAFAEGIGEALQPVALPETWYVVLEPPVQGADSGNLRRA